MADDFLNFISRFSSRYVKLTRLNVVLRQLIKPKVVVVGLGMLVAINFWPHSPIQKAILRVGGEPNNAQAHLQLAKEAAKVNDYILAESEFQLASQTDDEKVLGVRKEIFPEEEIKEEIVRLENIAKKVNARDIWLKLAVLYWQIFDEEKAGAAFEEAKFLDPNSKQVEEVGKLF